MIEAALAGSPMKRLYDLRQAVLEDIEGDERDENRGLPESLEGLSRAPARMIDAGIVNYSWRHVELARQGLKLEDAGATS